MYSPALDDREIAIDLALNDLFTAANALAEATRTRDGEGYVIANLPGLIESHAILGNVIARCKARLHAEAGGVQ